MYSAYVRVAYALVPYIPIVCLCLCSGTLYSHWNEKQMDWDDVKDISG